MKPSDIIANKAKETVVLDEFTGHLDWNTAYVDAILEHLDELAGEKMQDQEDTDWDIANLQEENKKLKKALELVEMKTCSSGWSLREDEETWLNNFLEE